MLKTTDRLSLILTLERNLVSLDLLQEYTSDILRKLCEYIEKNKVRETQYSGCTAIQRELINDERFFFYLEKLTAANIPSTTIDKLLVELHSHDEHGIDYPINRLISSMVFTKGSPQVFYIYLKYFSDLPSDKEQKENAVMNLKTHGEKLGKSLSALTDAEKSLFKESFLTKKSLIPDSFNRAFTLLQQPGMLDILRFIDIYGYCVSLSIENYETIKNSAETILKHFKRFHKQLGFRYMQMLLTQWIENNCSLYDLDVLCSKLSGFDEDQLYEVLNSRSGYINLIYGSKISNIPLAIIPRHQEDILIYAIMQKKNGFIRLIEENHDSFNYIDSKSILYKREFYTQYFNINSLNSKDLMNCRRMEAKKMLFDEFERGRVYSFNEIKALYDLPVQYYKLYAALDIPRIDNRLIVFKQLTKKKLLTCVEEDDCIKRLAEKLSVKPLSEWRDNEFAHIEEVKMQDVVELLIHFDEITKFIPQLKNRMEVKLLVRNRKHVTNYGTFEMMKMSLNKIDSAWSALIGKLGFNDQFLRKNSERVYDFLCMDNAEIANQYYDNLDEDYQREAFRRIVQAELMGEFGKLKYYADDLSKEIDYPLIPAEKSLWLENTAAVRYDDDVLVKECDDFNSTMLLGVAPHRTCLSYINGEYMECLLSCFDSNKKMLYAYIDGKIVGRAIIRLTKGKFSNKQKPDKAEKALSFVDLEAIENPEISKQEAAEKDRLVIFLECPYSAGISDANAAHIKDIYIDLMEKKAQKMGAMLVLSNSYESMSRSDFTRTLFHVYISKSKAGAQYLDSLNGSACVSDEGGYRSNTFFIRKDDILQGDNILA